MTAVVVTGAASHLGRVLLPRLRAAGWRVTGLDRVAPSPELADTPWIRADVRDPDLAHHLAGADAVVHLAFAVQRRDMGRDATRADMRSVNVAGSANLFAAARAAGAAHLVHASSAAVYGAWPDNPLPLTEDCPRRPQPGFAYSEDKAAVEAGLDAFESEGGSPIITRLRLHAIVGPGSRPLLNRIAATPFYIRAPRPVPVQCLWEDDAAAAVLAALEQRGGGAFNIAAPEPRPLAELITRHRRRALGLPYGPARMAHRLLARFTDAWGDPGWLAGLRYPLVLDSARAARVLHWRPERSVSDCIDSVRNLDSPTPRSP